MRGRGCVVWERAGVGELYEYGTRIDGHFS